MAVLPKIVYNFNENDASTIRDYSENGNDGTGSNLTIQDSTRIGKEAVFNSVNDVIDLGNITYLNGSSDMSVHLGISIDSSTASGYILIKDSQLLVYYNNTTSEIEIYLFVASGTAAVSAALTDDTYYDIDVIYTSNSLKIYVDGVLIETDSTESGAIATNTNDLTIGVATLSAFFLLNEFKLYSDPITTDIIDAVILNPNGVVSDNGVVSEFAIGDVLYTDLDNVPKYAIVSYVSTTTSEYRILPLTSGIFSGNALNRGGHLWDASRQSCFKMDKEPSIKFYDGVSKSTEVFAASKETYSIGVGGVDSSKIITVDRKGDLPSPSSGVITLQSGYTYFFAGVLDLTGDRLDTNGVVSILGSSPEVASIISTGLSSSTAILSSEYTISLRHIDLNHPTALDLDATLNPNQALDWFGVNFSNCTTAIGTIKNYGNAIFNTMGFLNSGGLTFDGTIGTIAFTDSIFENASGLTSVILPATLTVSRRFRINECSMVSLSGETALNVSTSASIPDEGYILLNVNFGGGGTYLTGVQSSDNKSRFSGCRGINNSSNIAQYYMQGNSTATTISTSSTFVKIAGTTTTGSYVEKFDVTTTSNKAVYTGSLTGFYKVHVISSSTAGNNQELELAIYKNGSILTPSRSKGTTTGSGKAENLAAQDIIELQTNDYIEIFVTNNTGTTNVTVEDLNVTIIRLN